MPSAAVEGALAQDLPLPLAQIYRRALNAKTPRDRHDAAYYLWEAALKVLGSVAIVEYAERADATAAVPDYLHNLGRPSTGQWWEFVRRLVPALAGSGDAGFAAVSDLLANPHNDLPRTAALDGAAGPHWRASA